MVQFIMLLLCTYSFCQVGKTFTSASIAAAAAAAGISVTAGGGISIAPSISLGAPAGSMSVAGLTGTINSVANLTSGVMAGVTAANVGDLSMFIRLVTYL